MTTLNISNASKTLLSTSCYTLHVRDTQNGNVHNFPATPLSRPPNTQCRQAGSPLLSRGGGTSGTGLRHTERGPSSHGAINPPHQTSCSTAAAVSFLCRPTFLRATHLRDKHAYELIVTQTFPPRKRYFNTKGRLTSLSTMPCPLLPLRPQPRPLPNIPCCCVWWCRYSWCCCCC